MDSPLKEIDRVGGWVDIADNCRFLFSFETGNLDKALPSIKTDAYNRNYGLYSTIQHISALYFLFSPLLGDSTRLRSDRN